MVKALASKGKLGSSDSSLPWRALGFLIAALSAPIYLTGRDHLPVLTIQLRLLPFTLMLLLGLWLCLAPLPRRLTQRTLPNWPIYLSILSIFLILCDFAAHAAQISRFAVFGYQTPWGFLAANALVVVPGLAFRGRLHFEPIRWF